jgi:hypothetical protein
VGIGSRCFRVVIQTLVCMTQRLFLTNSLRCKNFTVFYFTVVFSTCRREFLSCDFAANLTFGSAGLIFPVLNVFPFNLLHTCLLSLESIVRCIKHMKNDDRPMSPTAKCRAANVWTGLDRLTINRNGEPV